MDAQEIDYYRIHGKNSDEFNSVEKQIRKGIEDGIFAKDAY